jgi:hypothetical protein
VLYVVCSLEFVRFLSEIYDFLSFSETIFLKIKDFAYLGLDADNP